MPIPASFTFLPLEPETAWLLGLIFSDGSIRKDGFGVTLSVGNDDRDAVPKLSRILGINLNASPHGKGRVSNVHINSRRVCLELQNAFGLRPNKSLTMAWPEAVPKSMLRHFVRGLYDGDGCWRARTERTPASLKSSYASCSGGFVEALRYELINNVGVAGGTRVRVQRRETKLFDGYQCHPHYTLELGHSDSVDLGMWIYKDSGDDTRYARKYATWHTLQRPIRPRFGHSVS